MERAREVLRQTEQKLRTLVSEAANSGDYSSVVTLAAWARTLSDLTNSTVRNATESLKATALNSKKTLAVRSLAVQQGQNGYPRFLKQKDQLVRIAWSKREKREYQHKVPYSILKLLVNALADKGRDGRVFSTEEFLPIRESDAAQPIPNYQAYVGLSLLKQTGLIDQHGRQGYSIPQMTEFKGAVDAIWAKLPEK